MAIVKNSVLLCIGLASFVATFVAFGRLTCFLSAPINVDSLALKDLKSIYGNKVVLNALFFNGILAVGFILAHSFLRVESVKNFWSNIGLGVANRSIYNLISSIAILYLLKNWNQVPVSIWEVNLASPISYWIFTTLHSLCWIIIYGGSLLMDLPELLGLKQIFYSIQGLHQPSYYKSRELNNLYSRLRHPSFICLTTVLWCTNFMSLDRLILAALWTTYMFVAWNPDYVDLEYQRLQLVQKRTELRQL